METSLFTRFRRFHRQLRRWRYHNNLDEINPLELIDFIEYANEFSREAGLRPFLVTTDGVFVRTVPGFYMWFDPRASDSRLWGVEKTGLWEAAAVKVCLERISEGGVFLDIGENLGYYAMSVAKAADSTAVFAFEPVAEIFRGLALGVNASMLSHRIVLENQAVSDQCGSMDMVVNGQLSHMVSGETEMSLPIVSVPTTTLDTYCQEHGLSNVRVIKCDVEGLELKVLQGAAKVLSQQRPSIVIEIEDKWTSRYGYRGTEVFAFLQQWGYSGRAILADGKLGPKDCKREDKLLQSGMFLFEVW